MVRRRVFAVLATAAAFLGVILAGQPATAAPAWEYNVATSNDGRGCGEMTGKVEVYGGCGTFIPNGDHFWVRDTNSDGHSAVVRWENYDNGGTLLRRGACGQTAGVGKSGLCNKNVGEGTQIRYQVCTMEWGPKTIIECSDWFWRAS